MVVNCGSSSLKFQLMSMPAQEVVAKGLVDRIGQKVPAQFIYRTADKEFASRPVTAKDHTAAVSFVIEALTSGETAVIKARNEIAAFGHRVVHGGERFTSSMRITDEVMACIKECCPLAPLHNPANLEGIKACQKALPGVTNVAVFDTAFHQTMPPHAYHYALPYEYYQRNRIRRYGFHGTSHKHVVRAFAEAAGKPVSGVNVVTCHLGNGSSLTAVEKGKSIDTSMGFTPLQGVIMGTRSGDIDPAVVFFLMEHHKLSADEVNTMLNKKSGLQGFSGVSSDMRDIQHAAQTGVERAALVIEMWAYGIAKYIAAYVGILPRTDAVIFTAGIGENSPDLRTRICTKLAGIGIVLDESLNTAQGKARCITAAASRVPVWVIPTNEELEIARETYDQVKPS